MVGSSERWPQLHWNNSKDVIVHLSDKEFEELVEAWEQAWDRQIETDAEAGKLDQLAEEALRDFREGKCIRLP